MNRARMTTIGLGLLGALVFYALSLPLPLLLGPLFLCLIGGLAGVRMGAVGPIGTLMRTILGVAVGAAITPDLLHRLPAMAMSVALIPFFILIIGLIGYPFFRRVCGFDGPTAFYCAMPGGFQDMVVFGEEAGADVRALSLVHATRVLIIVTLLPFLLNMFYHLPLDGPVGEDVRDIPPVQLTLMAFAAIAGWQGAKRLHIIGASIIGPLVLTAIFSLLGLITHRPPAIAIMAAQFFIGSSIGAKYTGVTFRELRVDAVAGLVFCVILGVLSLVFAQLAVLSGAAHPVEGLLSFAPGGQGEMAVLAIIVGADLPFIVTHHVVRLVSVILGAPLIARWLAWDKDTLPKGNSERPS